MGLAISRSRDSASRGCCDGGDGLSGGAYGCRNLPNESQRRQEPTRNGRPRHQDRPLSNPGEGCWSARNRLPPSTAGTLLRLRRRLRILLQQPEPHDPAAEVLDLQPPRLVDDQRPVGEKPFGVHQPRPAVRLRPELQRTADPIGRPSGCRRRGSWRCSRSGRPRPPRRAAEAARVPRSQLAAPFRHRCFWYARSSVTESWRVELPVRR